MGERLVICGTGHRPNKLGGYGEDVKQKLKQTAVDYLELRKFDGNFIQRIISGGALGWDQALAWAAVELKTPLTLALPFAEFWNKWPKTSQDELENLVSLADKVVYVCEPGYAPWKMQKRNEWMVGNADHILALWDGSDGGTANCVRYAEKVGKPITNLWEAYNGRED